MFYPDDNIWLCGWQLNAIENGPVQGRQIVDKGLYLRADLVASQQGSTIFQGRVNTVPVAPTCHPWQVGLEILHSLAAFNFSEEGLSVI